MRVFHNALIGAHGLSGQISMHTRRAPAVAQEVYGKLEEPDGLGGLLRLRTGGPRLQDQVCCLFMPRLMQCLTLIESLAEPLGIHLTRAQFAYCGSLAAPMHKIMQDLSELMHGFAGPSWVAHWISPGRIFCDHGLQHSRRFCALHSSLWLGSFCLPCTHALGGVT